MRVLLTVVVLGPLALPAPARPCTAFAVDGEDGAFYVAKGYDWNEGAGMLVVNRRGVVKRALVFDPKAVPLTWTAKHASLTFNQYGLEFPNGGVNDAGLVVEVLWLDGSEYPDRDARPEVTELQWIQYHLDVHGSVAEMVAAAPEIRVAPAHGRVHYFACDATKQCATFEYLDGELVVHTGNELAVRALTNHPYPESLAHHRRKSRKKARPERARSSLDRFSLAASHAGRAKRPSDAFAILDRVSLGDYTKWNIVYEPAGRRIWWRTTTDRRIRTADLDDFDTACTASAQVRDLQGDGAFHTSAAAMNRNLLDRTLSALPLPAAVKKAVATYPRSLTCAPQ